MLLWTSMTTTPSTRSASTRSTTPPDLQPTGHGHSPSRLSHHLHFPLQVDDATVGFAEMMSIKLGELMNQPDTSRQALQTELMKGHAWLPPSASPAPPASPPPAPACHPFLRIPHHLLSPPLSPPSSRPPPHPRRRRRGSPAGAGEEGYGDGGRAPGGERRRRRLARLGVEDPADGKGDAAAAKRFHRRDELKLLVQDADEIKRLSAYQWQNISCCGPHPRKWCIFYHLVYGIGTAVRWDARTRGPPARPASSS